MRLRDGLGLGRRAALALDWARRGPSLALARTSRCVGCPGNLKFQNNRRKAAAIVLDWTH